MEGIERYLNILRRGGVIACATETLFGLLADALNPRAVARVVEIKRRESNRPIAVLIPSIREADEVIDEFPKLGLQLAERFWPGPLTLVMKARAGIPGPLVYNGNIGVRVPGLSPALEIVQAFGGPLTATSANRSMEPPVCTGQKVHCSIGQELDAIVPGFAEGGVASTVVDVTKNQVCVIRKGAISI